MYEKNTLRRVVQMKPILWCGTARRYGQSGSQSCSHAHDSNFLGLVEESIPEVTTLD
jgi:hypothetical protein